MKKRNITKMHWQLPDNTIASAPIKDCPGQNYQLRWIQVEQSKEPGRGIIVYCHFVWPNDERGCLTFEEGQVLNPRIMVCSGGENAIARSPCWILDWLKPGEQFCDTAIKIARTLLFEFKIADPGDKILGKFTLKQVTLAEVGGRWKLFENILRQKHNLPPLEFALYEH
jgi:hypothetical protein